ncbi:type II secretion system F family protein [Arthrobacter crystallopoietes]|uniref:type II secretion system F family protein n=1 Tax=Crystallibacter crystallopoietes TaxID=37928 RepID=UPI0011113356|nr:type II secretion system F family protein [Arthrobacter crystallopoietes]
MSPLVIAAAAALALSLPLLAWSVLGTKHPQQDAIRANLTRGLIGMRQTKRQRGQRFEALASRFTPGSFAVRLERQLALAGRPEAWPLKRLMLAKIVLAVAATVLCTLYVAGTPGPGSVLLAAVVTTVAYFVPDLLLYSKGQERQTAIGKELPDTLDQMTIAVEAGLGFDAAMARAGQNGNGPLAAELIRTLQDMQVGRSRRQAYESLAERTTSKDLQQFVRAVIQADAYGVSVANVLRTQAAEMRVKRRQRAEEKAMQIPVKVIFPLMVCILPVLFIALLGPAALNVIDTLSG